MDYLSCMHLEGGCSDMLLGRDGNRLPALSLAAPGAAGSTYNYTAPFYLDLVGVHASGDLSMARLPQQPIDMFRLPGKDAGNGTGKAFMRMRGMDCGGFRLHVRNKSEAFYEAFVLDAEYVGFRSFSSKLQPVLDAIQASANESFEGLLK